MIIILNVLYSMIVTSHCCCTQVMLTANDCEEHSVPGGRACRVRDDRVEAERGEHKAEKRGGHDGEQVGGEDVLVPRHERPIDAAVAHQRTRRVHQRVNVREGGGAHQCERDHEDGAQREVQAERTRRPLQNDRPAAQTVIINDLNTCIMNNQT